MGAEIASKPSMGFNELMMKRFWELENEFLAAFADTDCNLDVRCNRMLLCAVLFGGLLDPAKWSDWIDTVKGQLEGLPVGQALNAADTRSVYIHSSSQIWFADPLTMNLFARPCKAKTACSARDFNGTDANKYTDIIHLSKDALIEKLQDWVLPAAKAKATVLWPPLVVEHCAGALNVKSLEKSQWGKFEKLDRSSQLTELLNPVGELENIRFKRPSPQLRRPKKFYLKDKGFSFIRDAISNAIEQNAKSADPKLALEREAMKDELVRAQGRHVEAGLTKNSIDVTTRHDLGWWIYQWFLENCPDRPLEGKKPKHRRASTLYDYVITLGCWVNWSDLWRSPLNEISAQMIEQKLLVALKERPQGLGIAKRLYSFLGFGTFSREDAPKPATQPANIKNQILAKPEYEEVLTQLHDRTGARGAHWLATMLMFRCGLRTREIVAMEIDHIIVMDKIVELKVAATPYVALKNKTSRRVLPLHALLSEFELGELQKWRAQRIYECKGLRRHTRLLFATIYDPSDYEYLFEPIENAIRKACNSREPTDKKRKSTAYIFSRCSVLRHSFVSYAVATMLFPRDDGGFQLPPGITSDLVSISRREKLERVLLTEGHLGLSSLEAVRQLTGHASYKRTLGTYTHLMDMVCGAYSWRRSSEPSLPAEVLCKLAEDEPMADTLSHDARKASAAEQATVDAAIHALRSGENSFQLMSPRERRPRGKTVPKWMPQGNTFLSQIRKTPHPATEQSIDKPYEWRRNDVTDWRTLDQIVQMASRGVPARLIADEYGVRQETVERLAQRYYQLLCLRRRTTVRSKGKLRHALLLQKPDGFGGVFDIGNGCWYGALKPMPSVLQERIDQMWSQLQVRRGEVVNLSQIRAFLSKHQDGRIQSKRRKALEQLSNMFLSLFSGGKKGGLFTGGNMGRYAVVIKTFSPPSSSKHIYQLHFQPRFTSDTLGAQITGRWPATGVLLHLMLLAEAASVAELPDVLVTTPVGKSHTNVAAKILAHQQEKLNKRTEMDLIALSESRKAKRTQEEARQNARTARKVRQRKRYADQARGEKDFEVEIRPAKFRRNLDISAQVAKRSISTGDTRDDNASTTSQISKN